MVEKHTFPCRGLSIEVSSGDATTHAYIKYTEDGVKKDFLIETVSTAKSKQQLTAIYYKYFRDISGNILNTDVQQKATYVPEESYAKTYASSAPSVGQKVDQVGVNTVLYELKGVRCFDLEKNVFAPPVTADAVSTPCTFILVPPDPENPNEPPQQESNNDGTIKVTPVDFIGSLKYTLVELDIINGKGLFTGLPAGAYTIIVDSNLDVSPCTIKIEVGSVLAS